MFDVTGVAKGTPRTYGNLENDRAWCGAVVRGQWSGLKGLAVPLREAVRIDFSFRVNPLSPDYGGHEAPNGRDLDTMILQDSTMGALTVHRSQRPSLKLVESPARCSLVCAEKTLVTHDSAAGVDIRVQPMTELDAYIGTLPEPDLRIRLLRSEVQRSSDLPDLVEQVAEKENRVKQLTFQETDRIGIVVLFAIGTAPKNVFSPTYLESVIDALGNSRVGGRRLFAEDRFRSGRGIRNTDDSIVFRLICVNQRADDHKPIVELGVYSLADALPSAWSSAGI